MLIEFNGLPGCGKSTIARNLIESFKDKGIECFFLQNQIYYYSHNKHKLLLLILRYLVSKEIRVLNLYYNLTRKKIKASFKIAFNSWRNYCICLETIKKSDKTCIIADQFVIQSVISCFHNIAIAKYDVIQQLIDIIEKSFNCCIFVDVTSTPCIAAERIKCRNTHGGRLDDLDESNMSKLLHLQAENLVAIRNFTKRNHVITIDSSDSPKVNSTIIFERIERLNTLRD